MYLCSCFYGYILASLCTHAWSVVMTHITLNKSLKVAITFNIYDNIYKYNDTDRYRQVEREIERLNTL